MDVAMSKIISEKISPFLHKKDNKGGLIQVRKLMKEFPADELKVMEMEFLFRSRNYSEAIKIGTQYFNKMESSFEKADMASALQMVYMELGDGIAIKELGKEKIKIYESIIHDKTTPSEEKNLASLNLSGEYRRAGKPDKALEVSKRLLNKFRRAKVKEEDLLSLYGEFVHNYAKLYNNGKVNEYKAKIIAGYYHILMSSRYTKGYKKNAIFGLDNWYRMIGTHENALIILKRLEKELKNNKNRDTILRSVRKEISKLYGTKSNPVG